MKIMAKDVKVGMTIKWGVVTITVKEIKPFTQKNGKKGKLFYGPATRSMGKGFKPCVYDNYDISAKDETWLILK